MLPDCLSKVMQVRPVSFKLIGQTGEKRSVGFIAQDWHAVQPEVISFTETETIPDLMGIAYNCTIPVLLGAIQELTARVAALEARLP